MKALLFLVLNQCIITYESPTHCQGFWWNLTLITCLPFLICSLPCFERPGYDLRRGISSREWAGLVHPFLSWKYDLFTTSASLEIFPHDNKLSHLDGPVLHKDVQGVVSICFTSFFHWCLTPFYLSQTCGPVNMKKLVFDWIACLQIILKHSVFHFTATIYIC